MLTSFICNALLVITKGTVGVIANSHALIADAVHSLCDVIAFFINYYAYENCRMLSEIDKESASGPVRDRMTPASKRIRRKILEKELHSTYLSGITYLAFGIAVYIYNSVILILGDKTPPDLIALIVAFITLVVYVLVYKYSKTSLKDNKKCCFVNSRNTYFLNKMNLFAGTTVVIGLIGARIGFPIMDAMAGVVIGALMISIGINFFHERSKKIVDVA